MASKQTRRSISVRGTTYSLLRDFCSEHDRSMSDVVEELLSRILAGDAEAGQSSKSAKKTVAPLVARAPQMTVTKEMKAPPVQAEPAPVAKAVKAANHNDERGAVRVDPRPAPAPAPAPAPRAAAPTRSGPARPVPIANAGRPAPTPAAKVEGTQRGKPGNGDYRAIRF